MDDVPPTPTEAEDGPPHTLDEDLAALLSLGLQISDVERLWRENKEVDMSEVFAAGARLLGQPGVPVKRQVTVGLEIASSAPARADVTRLAEMLRNELDEPPEHFRDPIMLTLMSDPVVISSGHVFDRSTVFDGTTFRFQCCPMTRAHVEPRAFPLVYLKAQIVDFKLRRLTGIWAAVEANVPPADEPAREALLSLLETAKELLDGLKGTSSYHQHVVKHIGNRKNLMPPEQWPALLRELSGASDAQEGSLQQVFATMVESVQGAVRERWEQG